MAVRQIFDVNQPVLRARARKVTRISQGEKRLLDDMLETMRAANGVGLAAPQIGVSQRLIVVEVDDELYQLVNPEVAEVSDETDIMREGCLSLPNYYGPVERPVRATVRGVDKQGRKVKIRAEGLLARVLQHEIDHLDGVLFFDPQRMRSLSDLRYEPPAVEGQGDSSEPGGDAGPGDASLHDEEAPGLAAARASEDRVQAATAPSAAPRAEADEVPAATAA